MEQMSLERRQRLQTLVAAYRMAPSNGPVARALYEALQPVAMSVIRKKRVAKCDQHVLCNEALFKVFQFLPTLDDVMALECCVLRATHWVTADYFRAKAKVEAWEVLSDLDEQDAEGRMGFSEWATCIEDPIVRRCLTRQIEAFAADHPMKAAAVDLIDICGHSRDELAKHLGKSIDQLSKYLYKCRAELLGYLSVCEG
ncbi:sigma-70 family RNA polymerase sigma factor [Aquabacterium lacunae]|uniref:Sigma-70 family RNA polymerase sigma factor n=1 Tax=Aquabacterium lacunae TaxID=2528630 RepID=A0A4Q9H4U1_9BURK|nr:sigma-70 family RNA polymerase sigma factor [Aquabacterium lacunae]TBO31279.1 sigma-70 family RNA polymerase sigma factor [Aquabacterium lacunae]